MSASKHPGLLTGRGESAVVATHTDFADAQQLVDRLVSEGVPGCNVSVIARGLRRATQRPEKSTIVKGLLIGAAVGVWTALLIALAPLMLTGADWGRPLLLAVALGAAWGAVFGAVTPGMLRARENAAREAGLAADDYQVVLTKPKS